VNNLTELIQINQEQNMIQEVINKQVQREGYFFILIGIITAVILCLSGCGGTGDYEDAQNQQECLKNDPGQMGGPCTSVTNHP